MILACETLKDSVNGRLAVVARNLIIAGLAPEQAQHRQKKGNSPAVIEVLQNYNGNPKKCVCVCVCVCARGQKRERVKAPENCNSKDDIVVVVENFF